MTPILIIFDDKDVWNNKDGEGNYTDPSRGKAASVGGDHQRGNQGSKTIICVTDTNGWDEVLARPSTFDTTYEKVKGYSQQVIIDDIPQWGDYYTVTPPLRQVWVENWVEVSPDVWEDQGEFVDVQDPDYQTRDKILETIDPVQPDTARYNAMFTPNHINELMGIPGGYDPSHLLEEI